MASERFGATVEDARGMVLDAAAGTRATSSRAPSVDDDRVGRWLDDGTARVHTRILGYERLASASEQRIESAARGVVTLYAASMLADVVHPERAGRDGRLGDVLWERFVAGLNDLGAAVSEALEGLEPGEEEPEPGTEPPPSGADAKFPVASAWRTVGW